MTPHQHYKIAEKLLEVIDEGHAATSAAIDALLKAAQVHATLASVQSWPPDERGKVDPYKKS